MIRSCLVLALALAPASLAVGGCKDRGKESARRANEDTTALAALVERDVAEVERGLPEGATKFVAVLAPVPAGASNEQKDPSALRQKLNRVRREVPDLVVAKSTFFALADDKGIALRNDLETDVMAGRTSSPSFPGSLPR